MTLILSTASYISSFRASSFIELQREAEKRQIDCSRLEDEAIKLREYGNSLTNWAIVNAKDAIIINEEEIVKVELAKRVTVESVIHLTQHTNLIQDINEELCVLKDGLEITFIPRYCESVEISDGYQSGKTFLEETIANDNPKRYF